MRLSRALITAAVLALSACTAGAAHPPVPIVASVEPVVTPGADAASTLVPPSVAYSVSPAPSAPSAIALGSIHIPFADRDMDMEIVGEPGIVIGWRAATVADLDRLAWGGDVNIALGRLSDNDLVLGWIGTVCDVKATLTVSSRRLTISPAPRHGCDAMAVGRGMVLTFPTPIDPKTIKVELADTVLLP